MKFVSLAILIVVGCGGATPSNNSALKNNSNQVSNNDDAQIQFIADTMNRLGVDVRECYTKAIADDMHINGILTLMATILGEGLATVAVAKDEVNEVDLRNCVVALWQEQQWPVAFVKGDVVQLPPLSFVAPDTQTIVSESNVKEERITGQWHQKKRLLHHKNTGNLGAVELNLETLECVKPIKLTKVGEVSLHYVIKAGGRLSNDHAAVLAPLKVLAASGVSSLEIEDCKKIEVLSLALGKKSIQDSSQNKSEIKSRGPVHRVQDILFEDNQVTILGAVDGQGAMAMVGEHLAKPNTVWAERHHKNTLELIYVVQGNGTLTIDHVDWFVQVGDAINIPAGVKHTFKTGNVPFKSVHFFVTPNSTEK